MTMTAYERRPLKTVLMMRLFRGLMAHYLREFRRLGALLHAPNTHAETAYETANRMHTVLRIVRILKSSSDTDVLINVLWECGHVGSAPYVVRREFQDAEQRVRACCKILDDCDAGL